jgi:hypothetical protein
MPTGLECSGIVNDIEVFYPIIDQRVVERVGFRVHLDKLQTLSRQLGVVQREFRRATTR